ncbi:polyprenyl synthetase family protein [Streptomyces klenkii]
MNGVVIGEHGEAAAACCAVDRVLEEFLARQLRAAVEQGLPGEVAETVRDFLRGGGKRIRPALCVVGWWAAGGRGLPEAVVQTAASLEMFHAFALIHDDVMDDSGTRRGRPTVHRLLAGRHQDGRVPAAADRLGTTTAILVGDAALAWSDELVHTAGLDPARLTAVLPMIHTMRTQTMYGQYLDVTAAGRPTTDLSLALTIARYKSARYTVLWPLLIGATLADTPRPVAEALRAYAEPAGEAFQLRDDLLGVFGLPARTGKSHLDDLREGKHTALIALALERAEPGLRHTLSTLLGRPDLDEDRAGRIRQIILATGAREAVEDLIRTRRHQALEAVDQGAFPPEAAAALRHLAQALTARAV